MPLPSALSESLTLLGRLRTERPGMAPITPFRGTEPPEDDTDTQTQTGPRGSLSYARELSTKQAIQDSEYRLEVLRRYVRTVLLRAKHLSEVAAKLENLEKDFPHFDYTFGTVREEFGLSEFEGASLGRAAVDTRDTSTGPIQSLEQLLQFLSTPAAEDADIKQAYIRSYTTSSRGRALSRAQLTDRLSLIAKNVPQYKPQVKIIKEDLNLKLLPTTVPGTLSTTVGIIHSLEYLLSRLDEGPRTSTWAHDCIRSYIMNKRKRGLTNTAIDEKLMLAEKLRWQYGREFVACREEFGLPFSRVFTSDGRTNRPMNGPMHGHPAGHGRQYSGAAVPTNSQPYPQPYPQSYPYPQPYPQYVLPGSTSQPPPVPPPPGRAPYIAPAVTRAADDTVTEHGEELPAYTMEDAEREAAVRIEQAHARSMPQAETPEATADTTADLLARLRVAEEAQAAAEAARADLEARLAAAEAAAAGSAGPSSAAWGASSAAAKYGGELTSPPESPGDSKAPMRPLPTPP